MSNEYVPPPFDFFELLRVIFEIITSLLLGSASNPLSIFSFFDFLGT